jgi:hypothetical protein
VVELALRLESKVVQIGHAVDDLRVKILARRLEAAVRGFNTMQINEIEGTGMRACNRVERTAGQRQEAHRESCSLQRAYMIEDCI